MQPCQQTQTPSSAQWASTAPQRRIPWWGDLTPAVRTELQLSADIPWPTQICDVIVIGGGVAGLSAALSARKAQAAGAQVVLLEREGSLGYGATGRNAGILSAGINMGLSGLPPDDPLITLWTATTRVLRSLVEEAQQPGSLLSARLTGALTLAESKHAARALIQATGPTARPNARIYALAFAADLPESFPLFWDASPYTYADFRPGNGRLGVSGGRYGKAGVTLHDERYHVQLAALTRRWLPELVGQEPQFKWAVDLYVKPDLLPELQPLGSSAPGYSIEGLGALGVLPGIVLGRQAGQLVMQ
jgi:hypothetical protein